MAHEVLEEESKEEKLERIRRSLKGAAPPPLQPLPGKLGTPLLAPVLTDEEKFLDEPAVAPAAAQAAGLGDFGTRPGDVSIDEEIKKRATKGEKKQLDKLGKKIKEKLTAAEQDKKRADRNVETVLTSQEAEAEIRRRVLERVPGPSSGAKIATLASGGLFGAMFGTYAKDRKSKEAVEQAIKRYRELQKDDRAVRDAAKKSRAALAGKAAAGVGTTDKTNMSKVRSLIADLEGSHSLPPNYLTFPGGFTGDSSTYGAQLTALNVGLLPTTGKKGRGIPANPQASIIAETLKNRLEVFKTIRTANRERWKNDGAAAMSIDGSFPPAFIARMNRESPEAMTYAIQGTLDPKAVPAAAAHKDYKENHRAAEEMAFNIFKYLGQTPAEAVAARDSLLESLVDKRIWTQKDGMDYLRESKKQLARYFQNTGGPFVRDPANEGKILELDMKRKKIVDELNDGGLEGEKLKKLQGDWEANRRERANLDREMFLTDPEEVKAANEAWVAAKGERIDERNLLSNRAAADIDKSREYITDELWDSKGGDKEFLETVILGKDKKVVTFDPEKHKDQEAFTFVRIKLGKRNAAMATRVEERVTAWDTSMRPLTMGRKTVSALEPEVIGHRPLQMLTAGDIATMKRVSKGILDLDEGVDVDIRGRLRGNARQEVLAWMETPRGQAVLNTNPANFKLFLRGFMPEQADLNTLGGEGGFDVGLEIWNGIKDLGGLKRMLNTIEAKEAGAAGAAPETLPVIELPVFEDNYKVGDRTTIKQGGKKFLVEKGEDGKWFRVKE